MIKHKAKMDKSESRNLDPHRPAKYAMWLYGERHSKQRGGSMDFWDSLTVNEKNTCRRMAKEIVETRLEVK